MTNKINSHTIEASVNYAKVHNPANKYKSEDKEYSVDAILNEDQANELTSIFNAFKVELKAFGNFRIKPLEDGMYRFKFKRNEFNSQGTATKVDVTVLGDNGKLVDLPSNILIGNGSTAAIHFITIEMADGTSVVQLTGLQVLNLVPYVSQGGGMKAVAGGQTLAQMQSLAGAAVNEAPVADDQSFEGNAF